MCYIYVIYVICYMLHTCQLWQPLHAQHADNVEERACTERYTQCRWWLKVCQVASYKHSGTGKGSMQSRYSRQTCCATASASLSLCSKVVRSSNATVLFASQAASGVLRPACCRSLWQQTQSTMVSRRCYVCVTWLVSVQHQWQRQCTKLGGVYCGAQAAGSTLVNGCWQSYTRTLGSPGHSSRSSSCMLCAGVLTCCKGLLTS
jgi:hypothetical protein